jgi:hypothetical protein
MWLRQLSSATACTGNAEGSFLNRYDHDRVANVSQATRYPAAHAGFTDQACPAGTAGPAVARASG